MRFTAGDFPLKLSSNFTVRPMDQNPDPADGIARTFVYVPSHIKSADGFEYDDAFIDAGYTADVGNSKEKIPTSEEFFSNATQSDSAGGLYLAEEVRVISKASSRKKIGKYDTEIIDAQLQIKAGGVSYVEITRFYWIRYGNNLLYLVAKSDSIPGENNKNYISEFEPEVEQAIANMELR